MVYLKPSSKNYINESFKRVKSCKNVSNTNQSSKFIDFSLNLVENTCDNCFNLVNEDFERLRTENSLLRKENQLIKTRNKQLIDQLREKSMHFSLLQMQKSQVETQVSKKNLLKIFCNNS